ncbi:MAG: 2-dehydropantoate 2-reductase [Lachnospiraceae bacterium]|nr:2-dehydropantoate 2-reductase [Lachnospiraceae bacterium]
MRIAIIGSGAIGCLYGAYLSRDNEVYMLCRRQKVADSINRDGLTIFEPDGTEGRYPNVRACLSGECSADVDLIIVIVKGADTKSAMEANLNIIRDDTWVMTLQNGGGNDMRLAEFVPMERIIIGTTRHNSVNLDNGNVRHSGSGATHIGSNVKGTDLSAIANVFEKAGLETVVSDDIQRIIWSKLFVNLSINTFTAITKSPIGSMIDNEYAWNFAEKMICEAIDVAEAEGQHFSYLEILDSVHKTCEAVSTGFSSMSQDVMNCRKTEVDVINGFVVERASVHNVPAPYNTFVRNLIHSIENTYKEQIKPQNKYLKGEVILKQGDKNPSLFKVMQGNVSLYTNYGSDKEYFIGIYGQGKCFGEYSCFSGNPTPYTVVANEDTIIMEIPKSDLHNFISINPKNAEEIFGSMAQQLAMISKHVELLNNKG